MVISLLKCKCACILATLVVCCYPAYGTTKATKDVLAHFAGPAQIGEKIRVSAPRFTGGLIMGKLVYVGTDSIVVARAKDTSKNLSIPRDKIIGVEVQRGQKRNWLI